METVAQTKIEEVSDKSYGVTQSVQTVDNQEAVGDENRNLSELRRFSVCCLIVAAIHIYYLDI